MTNSAEFWNKLSSRYDEQVKNKYAETYELTIAKTKKYLKSSDRVLDFACGTGITTVKLAKDVKEILAIDISKEMIGIAKNKIDNENLNNVHFNVCDIMDDTIENDSFDVMLAFNILYFLDNINDVFERINHILKKDGIFISATDCLGEKKSFLNTIQSILSKTGRIPSVKRYKMKKLIELFERAGFTIIETDNLYKDPPNLFIVAQKKA